MTSETFSGEGAPMKDMFFIVGNPRSGTTMLRLMLNAHGRITVPPECGFALWLYEKFHARDLADDGALDEYVEALLNCRKFETWGMDRSLLVDEVRSGSDRSYRAVTRRVYMAYAKKFAKTPCLVGDKNNYYISESRALANAFPQSKFIIIVRDGRDVAASYQALAATKIDSEYKPRLPSDAQAVAEEWRRNNLLALDTFGPEALVVRYEDLVHSPQIELRRICDYLGVAYDENMLEFHRANDEPVEFLQWKSRTRAEVSNTSIGVYKTKLSDGEIASFEEIAGGLLRRLGYI